MSIGSIVFNNQNIVGNAISYLNACERCSIAATSKLFKKATDLAQKIIFSEIASKYQENPRALLESGRLCQLDVSHRAELLPFVYPDCHDYMRHYHFAILHPPKHLLETEPRIKGLLLDSFSWLLKNPIEENASNIIKTYILDKIDRDDSECMMARLGHSERIIRSQSLPLRMRMWQVYLEKHQHDGTASLDLSYFVPRSFEFNSYPLELFPESEARVVAQAMKNIKGLKKVKLRDSGHCDSGDSLALVPRSGSITQKAINQLTATGKVVDARNVRIKSNCPYRIRVITLIASMILYPLYFCAEKEGKHLNVSNISLNLFGGLGLGYIFSSIFILYLFEINQRRQIFNP